MSGLGHVVRGGPPLVEKLSSTVTLSKISVGGMDNNAYLLESGSGGVLIDAADDAEQILALIGDGTVGHRRHDPPTR